jgi:GT2 family glycosyltransferase/SAM-dependent methyltransferase
MGPKKHGSDLAFTGERVVPGRTAQFLVLEHLVRYAFASQFAAASKILDVGCGTGYGASLLAQKATSVVGIDNSPKAINYAQSNYGRANLSFSLGDCRSLPFRERFFDLVVMFEVIEHVVEQQRTLSEIQRVLAPKGVLILSTPNAAGPTKIIEDVNPFHFKELTETELLELLRPHFAHARLLYQHELSASSIQAPAAAKDDPIALAEDFSLPSAAKYFIAVCSARAARVSTGRTMGVGGIDHQIASIKDLQKSIQEIQVLNQQLKENEREYAKTLFAHQRDLEAKQGAIDSLNRQMKENEREYAKTLFAHQRDLEAKQGAINTLDRLMKENEREYAKTLFAHQRDLEAKQGAIDSLNRQMKENEREYAKTLLAHQRDLEAKQGAIDSLVRQREERERDYAEDMADHAEAIRNKDQLVTELERTHREEIAARDRQLAELEIQNTLRKIELEWLYHWIPTNRLARKLLFGKNLRNRVLAKLHFPSGTGQPNPSVVSVDQEKAGRDALKGRPLEFETPTEPEVSIIIPVYDGSDLTFQCLKSLITHTSDVKYEVLVVDDSSRDATQQMLSQIKGLRVFRNEENRGFILSCNRGAEEARGKYLLFLNNDTTVTPHWLKELRDTLESEPRAGAVGAKLIYHDRRLQEAGSILWRDGSALGYGRGDDPGKPEYLYLREVDYCSAACMLVRRGLFQELGGFDVRYVPAYYEDADLCMGLREKGYKVLFQPRAIVHHHEYSSSSPDRSKNLMEANQLRFAEKWRARLQNHYEYGLPNVLFARESRDQARILVVDDRVPTPDAGSGYPRAYALLNMLAELDYRVTLFPAGDPAPYQPYLSLLQQRGVEVFFEKTDFAAFTAERKGFYDLVLVSRPHNFQKTYTSIKEFFPNAGLIYDAEALFFVREELKAKAKGETLSPAEHDDAVRAELSLMNLADAIICVSESEKNFICQKSGAEPSRIFVWGHPLSPQPTPKAFRERKDVLFVGAFPVPDSPNEDAVVYFIKEVLPQIEKELDCTFSIVGAQPPVSVQRHQSSRVKVLGYVKDLSEFYNDFKVFVVPHRYSAGIPWKLSEAMSRGIPAVISPLTAVQLALTDGKEALVGSTPSEFASRVVRLYKDEALWNEIRANALDFVQKFNDPLSFKKQLDEIIRSSLPQPVRERT